MTNEFQDKMQECLSELVVDMEKAVQENLDNMTKYVDAYAALAVAAQSEADILKKMHNGAAADMVQMEAELYRLLSTAVEESQKKLRSTPFLESPVIAFNLLAQENAILEKIMENRRAMLAQAKSMVEMLGTFSNNESH